MKRTGVGKTDNQQGFGVFECLLVVVVLSLLIGISLFLWGKQKTSPASKSPSSKTTSQSSEETDVTIPEGYTVYTNGAAGFSVAHPSLWGEELQELADPALADVTVVSPELDKVAIDSPASVLSGRYRISVSAKASFTISTKHSVTVKPVKDKDHYTWEVTEVNPAETKYKVGDTYQVQSLKTPSGITAFDFGWTDEGRTYARWVFEAGNSFVTVDLPYLWTPEADSYALTPDADRTLYSELSEQLIRTAKILQ